jgi:hypothetical protein
MKGKSYFLFLISYFLFLISCSPDAVDYGLGAYYVEIATAGGDNAFLLDNGKTVYNVNGKKYASIEAGNRVYLYFSYTDERREEIIIHSCSNVFKGELKAVEKEKIQEYANDPILFESAWIGSRYLNLLFYIEMKSETHSVSLITDESPTDNPEEIRLYFRHNIHNDPPGHPVSVCTSYDLSSVLGEPRGDRTLLINFNTSNYGDKTYEFKY